MECLVLHLGVVGLIDEEFRIIAWIGATILIIVSVEIKNYAEIVNLRLEQKKQKERLSIYKELIDIKSDIKLLKEVKWK